MVLNGNILTVTASWFNFTLEKGRAAVNLKTRKTIIVTKREKNNNKKNPSPLNQKPLVTGWPGNMSGIFPRTDTWSLTHLSSPQDG